MELREWATRILSADTLEEKLLDPGVLTDESPGSPLFWKEPVRPVGMGFTRRKNKGKLPRIEELQAPDRRAVCLHRFAGHELLAVEIMAFALLAYPETPRSFRMGVAHTLKDEQRHLKMYCDRLIGLGASFGDLPQYRHFWAHVRHLLTPSHYVSTLSLTLEMANLDFAPMYGRAFEKVGDDESAELMAQILRDEIAHVGFGWRWLMKWKDENCSEWDAWERTQSELLNPQRACGRVFNEESRLRAGLPEAFVERLRDYKVSPSKLLEGGAGVIQMELS
jgi:uncharacterized ferritin-like protein (DUF455 family)